MISRTLQNLTNNKLLVFFFLLIIGFIAYYNIIKGPFFYDDEQFIVKNEFVHQLDVKKIYTSSVTQGANIKSNFYRPNQQLVFAITHKFFGLNAKAFHINSILFHSLNAFLVFLLFSLLGFNRNTAFAGSLLFLLHPIHTEAVAYISGFADIIGLSFMLSGIILFIKTIQQPGRQNRIFIPVYIVCFILALFSKESLVIILPITILVSIFLLRNKDLKTNKTALSGIISTSVLTLIYLTLKFSIFNFS